MFAARYFAATYYAPRYFPEHGATVPPIPPVVVTGGGGSVHPPFILPITGIADLVLPAFRCDALGVVLPPSVRGTADLFLPLETILASLGKSLPATIKAVGQFAVPEPYVHAAGVMRMPRQKAVTVDDLRRQVEGLQRRVQELEDERYAIRRDDDRD